MIMTRQTAPSVFILKGSNHKENQQFDIRLATQKLDQEEENKH